MVDLTKRSICPSLGLNRTIQIFFSLLFPQAKRVTDRVTFAFIILVLLDFKGVSTEILKSEKYDYILAPLKLRNFDIFFFQN